MNDNKRLKSVNSIEIYACGTINDLVCEKEEINYNNIIRQFKNN